MASMININSEIDDLYNRYKMPSISIKFEKNKTLILNLIAVAKALKRPAIYILKYFGIEIGTQTEIDKKNEKFFINGFHDTQKLQNLLNIFIKTYILCTECNNPETYFLVNNTKLLKKCIACGFQTLIKEHKLNNFIINSETKKK